MQASLENSDEIQPGVKLIFGLAALTLVAGGCAKVTEIPYYDLDGNLKGVGAVRYGGGMQHPFDNSIVALALPEIERTTEIFSAELTVPEGDEKAKAEVQNLKVGDIVTVLAQNEDCNGKLVTRERTGPIIRTKEGDKPQIEVMVHKEDEQAAKIDRSRSKIVIGELSLIRKEVHREKGNYYISTSASKVKQVGEFLANGGMAASGIMTGWGWLKYAAAAGDGKLGTNVTQNNQANPTITQTASPTITQKASPTITQTASPTLQGGNTTVGVENQISQNTELNSQIGIGIANDNSAIAGAEAVNGGSTRPGTGCRGGGKGCQPSF